jgi:LysR family transcriptional regulator, transcription activator of glutamate synthase operon
MHHNAQNDAVDASRLVREGGSTMAGDDLHWFLTLAETGRLTATAARYGVPQSTLTRRLQRLEQEVGAALFDRVRGRLVLTESGRIFYERGRRAQAERDAAVREIAELRNPGTGPIRLAFLHSFGVRMVPSLISRYRSAVPGATFQLFQGGADALESRVLDGISDLAVTAPRPTRPGLVWQRFLRQRLMLAVPVDHPLARRSAVGLSEVADQPFIALQAGYGLRRILDELADAVDVRPEITFQTTDLATVFGLVGAGLGIAVVPGDGPGGPQTPGRADPGEVALVPLRGSVTHREIGLVHRSGGSLSGPARAFAALVREWGAARAAYRPEEAE